MTKQTATVTFHGAPLTVITQADQKLVAMKPIVEGIGLGWQSQYNRIQRQPVLKSVVVMMNTTGADGKSYQMLCLPLDYLNGWLFGVDANRVREDIRDTLIMYQRECYQVLANYWQQGEAVNPRAQKALPTPLTTEQQSIIKDLVKSRVETLPPGKQAKAAITCWSALKSKFGCSYKQIESEQFSDAVSLVARITLEGELLGKEEPKRLDINFPIESLLVSRRSGMLTPRNKNTDFLEITLNDLREFHTSPCEELLNVLANEGYNVDAAWYEMRTYRNKLAYLMPLLDSLRAIAIEPQHVRQYLSWRKSAPVRANREKALLSAIWNFAREMGYTSLANPCSGVKGNRERGRDIYIEDSVYQAVYKNASAGLQDSMDLAYLTGQRVTDVRLMNESDIRDNQLWVKQGKTSAKRRIELVGELALLIERIRARKETLSAYSPQLIVNEIGEAMTASMLRSRFDKARQDAGIPKSAFQLRDLRAKAGTDKAENSGDILQARDQLGHTTVTMTEAYIRDRKGKKVTPTK